MSSGITFTDYNEAKEYMARKYDEGFYVTLKKRGNKYIVNTGDKITKMDIRETRPRIVPVEYSDTDDVNTIYNRTKSQYMPLRTSKRIKEIAKEEISKAGIKDIDIYITKRFRTPFADAGYFYNTKDSSIRQIGIHPIHQYTPEEYLREVIQHEIKHLQEEVE